MKTRKPRDKGTGFANEYDLIMALVQKGDVNEAVWQFQYNYERPAKEAPHQNRINAGAKVYAELMAAKDALKPAAPAAPPAAEAPAPAPEATAGETHATQKGEQVPDTWKGFRYFNQYDNRWADSQYEAGGDGGTIARSGCGATSLAMAISSLTGKEVLPTEIAKFNMENGLKAPNNGTAHIAFKKTPENYGLTTSTLGGQPSLDKIREATGNGGLIIAGAGGGIKGTPTGSEHIFLIRGVTEDGKILVLDPASFSRTMTAWESSNIINNIGGSTVISKG